MLARTVNYPRRYHKEAYWRPRNFRITQEDRWIVVPQTLRRRRDELRIPLQLQQTRRRKEDLPNQNKREVGWEPCLVGEQMGSGRPMGNLRGRDNLARRVRRYKRKILHSSGLTLGSNTMRRRRIELSFSGERRTCEP